MSRVSVIVTTKNNQATLDECLRSIVAQDYEDVELIVVDNESTDQTPAIAKKYTKKVYSRGPERSAQRNYGVSKSSGDYVLIVDSDMVLSPSVVGQCVAAIDTQHSAVIIPEESFGEGFWAQCKALERSFYVGVDWIEAPRFLMKAIYNKVGGYDEDIVGGEDWDLRNRLKQQTGIARITAMIKHDEGRLTLREIINSRKYYAQGFKKQYAKQVAVGQKTGAAQAAGVFGLFLSQPGKLLGAPIEGVSMLFMKVVEFGTMFIYSKV